MSELNELKVGDLAPEFYLKDKDEKKVCLKDFKGKNVIVYFYPKDNTPGCTTEAIGFTSILKDFQTEATRTCNNSRGSVPRYSDQLTKESIS